TNESKKAVHQAELIFVCVGTPSKRNGDLELKYLERVCQDIAEGLRTKKDYSTVVIRSTILPGIAESILIPLLERKSGKKAGRDFGFCVNPEFLREGSAISDYYNPPFTVIAQTDERSGHHVAQVYNDIDSRLYIVELGVAEMIKYASNAYHALKVVFANEIGNICKVHGINSHSVMSIFAEDRKLNISSNYLKPGFAFGGSCLSKDLRALLCSARRNDLSLLTLESILPSNQQQIDRVLQLLIDNGRKHVGLLGLSFKARTDDLRESPAVELAERLIGKGFDLSVYDKEVTIATLTGTNQKFINQVIPHIATLMEPNIEDTIKKSQNIVIAKPLSEDEITDLAQHVRPDQLVLDLVKINGAAMKDLKGEYTGISW
ncbi:nucleotide sugar dehydrogenase, partial [bacterium]|nr:nucleotide sugar dehydrogenase [bacterium]